MRPTNEPWSSEFSRPHQQSQRPIPPESSRTAANASFPRASSLDLLALSGTATNPQKRPSKSFPFDSKYDFSFRPETYWPDLPSEEEVLSRIKGTARRDIARRALAGEELERLGDQELYRDAMEFVLQDELSEEERERWGRNDPAMMGGEYLPGAEPEEVEIVRVELASATADVIEVRARSLEGRIHYQAVDEYWDEGERYLVTPEWSERPLTFGELIDLIDTACRGSEGYFDPSPFTVGLVDQWRELPSQGGGDPASLLGFVRVSSAFYPELGAYYEERANAWVEQKKLEPPPPPMKKPPSTPGRDPC